MSKYEIDHETFCDYCNRIENGLEISDEEILKVIYMANYAMTGGKFRIPRFDFFGHRKNENRWQIMREQESAACNMARGYMLRIIKENDGDPDKFSVEDAIKAIGGQEAYFDLVVSMMPSAKKLNSVRLRIIETLDEIDEI